MKIKHWLNQVPIAIDQLLNALLGGWSDETLSSYAYRLWRDGKPWGRVWMPVIDALFFWQKQDVHVIGHCHGAYLKEQTRYHFPVEMR